MANWAQEPLAMGPGPSTIQLYTLDWLSLYRVSSSVFLTSPEHLPKSTYVFPQRKQETVRLLPTLEASLEALFTEQYVFA